jgi:acetyltransferase
MRGGPEAEVAVLVTDAHQGEGMGTELVRRLIEVGRDEKLERVIAQMLPENEAMMSLARKLDFRVEPYSDRDDLIMVLDLGRSPRHATETYNWR